MIWTIAALYILGGIAFWGVCMAYKTDPILKATVVVWPLMVVVVSILDLWLWYKERKLS